MKKIYFLFLGLLTLPVVSSKADDLLLREDVAKLKDDMIMVQRQLYRDKNDTTAPQESVSNIQVRLGEYDQLLRDMNGKVENIEYRLNVIEKKLETFDKDIDLRFEQMKKHAGNTNVNTQKTNTKHTIKPLPKGVSAKELYLEVKKINPNVEYCNSIKLVSRKLKSNYAIAFVGAGDINLVAEQIKSHF